jgi:GrpB-like predicted nucleotidyltransferase (UPF0157 family)
MERDNNVDDDPVRIVPHDPAWALRFESEKTLIEQAIGRWLTGGVHHVGSTAVPGLAAKPVVDILVGVKDLPSSRDCVGELAQLDYCYAPYRAEEMHWFCKPNAVRRTHHLHLVPTDSPRYRAELAFRDLLRVRPELAERYQRLKQKLAAEHRYDREAYTEAKQSFIFEVLALSARADDVLQLTEQAARWARGQPDIVGMALVGSWARGAGRMDSDVDIIALAVDPDQYVSTDELLTAFGQARVVGRRRWGPVAETRIRLPSGLELELGITPPSWADTDPLDPGTRRVVQDGLRILTDPRGLLETLLDAVRAS